MPYNVSRLEMGMAMAVVLYITLHFQRCCNKGGKKKFIFGMKMFAKIGNVCVFTHYIVHKDMH